MASSDPHTSTTQPGTAQPGFKRWAWLAAAVVAFLLIMYLVLSAISHTPGPTTVQEDAVVQPPPSPAPQPAQ